MDPLELAALPARPESEFEWEDLLVRLELMPRALKVQMENAGAATDAHSLAEHVRLEAFVNDRLERAATGEAAAAPAPDSVRPEVGDPAEEVDRFVRLRSRNFAMLQRRGINVWDWSVEVDGSTRATVFQLLTLLARRDVELLGRLRTRRAPARSEC